MCIFLKKAEWQFMKNKLEPKLKMKNKENQTVTWCVLSYVVLQHLYHFFLLCQYQKHLSCIITYRPPVLSASVSVLWVWYCFRSFVQSHLCCDSCARYVIYFLGPAFEVDAWKESKQTDPTMTFKKYPRKQPYDDGQWNTCPCWLWLVVSSGSSVNIFSIKIGATPTAIWATNSQFKI